MPQDPTLPSGMQLDEYSKSQKIKGVYYLVPDTLEDNIESLQDFIYENH